MARMDALLYLRGAQVKVQYHRPALPEYGVLVSFPVARDGFTDGPMEFVLDIASI